MIWLLLALQAADGIVTWLGLEKRQGLKEGNPLVSFPMQWIGLVPALIIVKGAAASLSFYAATHIVWAAPALIALYAGVVIYNLRLVRSKEDS